jgi:hypothetical protein
MSTEPLKRFTVIYKVVEQYERTVYASDLRSAFEIARNSEDDDGASRTDCWMDDFRGAELDEHGHWLTELEDE